MPLINRCGGGGGTPQLCGQVENFEAKLGNLSVILSWTAPSPDEDNSFVGARIVRKTGSAPTGINDGTIVYEGTALTYTDIGLTAGTTYYYRAFAYNAKKKYQTEYRVINKTAMAIQPNFADNTWDTIIEACHADSVPDTWVTTDSKTMTIGGTSYQVDIIGKNHDTYTAGGIAPITFQLHTTYATEYALDSGSGVHTWGNSTMRNDVLPAILAIMSEEVKNGIRAVNKKTYINGVSATKGEVSDKLFLLSEDEFKGGTAEGTQYEYYKAGNSVIKANIAGNNTKHWTRSFRLNVAGSAWAISNTGKIEDTYYTREWGIAFAFCF